MPTIPFYFLPDLTFHLVYTLFGVPLWFLLPECCKGASRDPSSLRDSGPASPRGGGAAWWRVIEGHGVA